MTTLINNGRIITAENDYIADILIENGKIKLIGKIPDITVDSIIDATGKYVIPGGIDVHTHLDMPFGVTSSSDDFETGTIAAAFGGTTSIVDFATQTRGTRMRDTLDSWFKKAEGKAVIDYGFHMIISDLPDAHIEDMNEMVNEGVSSFKMFMAYPNSLMVDDAVIYKALKQTSKNGALLCMHAENGTVIDLLVNKALTEGKTAPIYHALTRPPSVEAEAVSRTIALAQMAGAPVYIVHVSSNDSLEKIAQARDRGFRVFGESCPQYLFLSLENMSRSGFEDAKFVFTPPLREKWNQDKLWTGLKNNVLQVVSTDHCPFRMKDQKIAGIGNFTKIPNGGPGIENRLQLMYQGGVNEKRISLNRWIELCSANPAKLFGMYPAKGTIAPGSDADIVIWNPDTEFIVSSSNHHMNVDYSLYEGVKINGNAETVISRGETIIKDKKFTGKPGMGKYIKRNTFASAF
jgi:dihydropyrimidinase